MTTKGYRITTSVYGSEMPRLVAAPTPGRAKTIVVNLMRDLDYSANHSHITSCRRYPAIDGEPEGFRDLGMERIP